MTKKRIVTLRFEDGDGDEFDIEEETEEPVKTRKNKTPLDDALQRTMKSAFAGLSDEEKQDAADVLQIAFAEVLDPESRARSGGQWVDQDVSDIEHGPARKDLADITPPRTGRKAMLKLIAALRAAGLSDGEVLGIVSRYLAPAQKSKGGVTPDPFTPQHEEAGVLSSLVRKLIEHPKGPKQVIKVSGADLSIPPSEADRRLRKIREEDGDVPIRKEV